MCKRLRYPLLSHYENLPYVKLMRVSVSLGLFSPGVLGRKLYTEDYLGTAFSTPEGYICYD